MKTFIPTLSFFVSFRHCGIDPQSPTIGEWRVNHAMTLYKAVLLFLLIIGSMSCYKKYTLGERITDLKIVVTATEQPNVYNFSTSTNAVIGNWDLGNGTKVLGVNSVTGSFPFAGNYTVTLNAYGQAGQTNTVSITLPVLEDNYNLLQDTVYKLLCGQIGDPDGKTWVIDGELRGHIAMWNNNSTAGPLLGDSRACPYSAISNGGDLRFGPTMYDDEVTFVLNNTDGPAFLYNNGDGKCLVSNTGSNAVYNLFLTVLSWSPSGGVAANTIPLPAGYTGNYNSDWQVPCTPPAGMTWTLVKGADASYTINFSSVKDGYGGFLLFCTDWSEGYRIISITEDRLVVKKKTATNNTTRQVVLIKKGTLSGIPLEKLPEPNSAIQ